MSKKGMVWKQINRDGSFRADLRVLLFWMVLVVASVGESRNWPLVQIHRGYLGGGKFTENTLPAFRAAKAAGHEMIELDIRLLKNGDLAVYHDEDLVRLNQKKLKLEDLSSTELKLFGINTLEEVLEDPEIPHWINIEIKEEKTEKRGLERRLTEILRSHRAENRVIVSSFNASVLGRMAELAPKIDRVHLIDGRIPGESEAQYLEKIDRQLLEAKTHIVSLYFDSFTDLVVKHLREKNIEFMAWTVNDKNLAQHLLQLGAVGIITDRVDLESVGPETRSL